MGGFSGGAVFRPAVDDSTIEYNGATLRLKDSGTTLAKLAAALKSLLADGTPMFGAGIDAGINAITYFPLVGGKGDATEQNVATRPPAGTATMNITKLRWQTPSDTSASTWVATLMVNGSASALASTKANGGSGVSSVQDNDVVVITTDSDEVSIRFERTAGSETMSYPTWTYLVEPVLA